MYAHWWARRGPVMIRESICEEDPSLVKRHMVRKFVASLLGAPTQDACSPTMFVSSRVSLLSRALITSAATIAYSIAPMTAHADDYISPHLVKVTTPLYKPDTRSFKPKLGKYEYTVSWQGIPAASCTLTVSESDGQYHIDAAARTYSGVDLLYRLRYEAKGTLDQEDLRPRSLIINHDENSRHKNIDIKFPESSGAITAVRSKSPEDPDKKHVAFTPDNFTLDPIGAAFLARSLPWELGQSRDFDVFNGKSRYLITLTAVRRATISFQGEQRKVFLISPRVRNLTTTKPRAKLREAFIYVSDDADREVLKIESSVFIGTVLTELDSFTPANQDASPLVIAQSTDTSTSRAQMKPLKK